MPRKQWHQPLSVQGFEKRLETKIFKQCQPNGNNKKQLESNLKKREVTIQRFEKRLAFASSLLKSSKKGLTSGMPKWWTSLGGKWTFQASSKEGKSANQAEALSKGGICVPHWQKSSCAREGLRIWGVVPWSIGEVFTFSAKFSAMIAAECIRRRGMPHWHKSACAREGLSFRVLTLSPTQTLPSPPPLLPSLHVTVRAPLRFPILHLGTVAGLPQALVYYA